MGLFDFLADLVNVAGQIKEGADVDKERASAEFKEAEEEIYNELQEKTTEDLIYGFHKNYMMDYRNNLIPIYDTQLWADPSFSAYRRVLSERDCRKIIAECRCERKLGYIILPCGDEGKNFIENNHHLFSCCECPQCGRKSLDINFFGDYEAHIYVR